MRAKPEESVSSTQAPQALRGAETMQRIIFPSPHQYGYLYTLSSLILGQCLDLAALVGIVG